MDEKRKIVHISAMMMPNGMAVFAVDQYGSGWMKVVITKDPYHGGVRENPWTPLDDLPINKE
ncbi:MAG: hypothetical protein Q7R79_00330 [bacterium]|nr:hypothetical protein [bacterium]